MKWLDRLKRLWTTPSKEVAKQKSVEESVAGQKEADSIHKHSKKETASKTTRTSTKIQAWHTQFDDVAESSKRVQVIIGFDFGTAFTKVVISGEGQKYGVPLNDNKQGTDKYLLPTRLYEDSKGNYFVDKPVNCVSSHTDLKMRILDGSLDTDAKDRIIAYIAWVLQKSRGWFMTEKQSVTGGSRLKWEVNIGLPTERASRPELRETYQKLVAEAWEMSTEPPHGGYGNGSQNNAERTLHSDLIATFPEFVAQIQGYISSPQRKPGIHTLVDVGAGTIDATVFIVHEEDGENIHTILSESVKPLGTSYLAAHRCEELGNNGWRPSPYNPFPSLEEFSRELGISEEAIKCKDKKFRGKIINNQIHLILEKAKDDCGSYGNNIVDDTSVNRREQNGIPLMLCGGGAQVEFYKEVVNTLMTECYGYLLGRGFLLVLDKLDAPGLLEEDHNRLSVAYGLSFATENIGEISRPEPIPLEEHNRGTQCPLCNGTGGGYGNCHQCDGKGFL